MHPWAPAANVAFPSVQVHVYMVPRFTNSRLLLKCGRSRKNVRYPFLTEAMNMGVGMANLTSSTPGKINHLLNVFAHRPQNSSG